MIYFTRVMYVEYIYTLVEFVIVHVVFIVRLYTVVDPGFAV